MTPPNRFSRSTGSPKAKDSSFMVVTSDKEMQKTLQFKKLAFDISLERLLKND